MTEEKFCHLHNHSYFSLLDGLASIDDLVNCAADLGYKSLALTDHGTCAGLYQFQKACEKKGIKPILGMEAYITEDHTFKEKGARSHHLVLLAKNKVGYKNLIYLSSFGYIHGFYYKPRIDFEVLKEHKEGLIVSSACAIGEIPDLLWSGNHEEAERVALKYKETFGEDFYIEIMSHDYNKGDPQEEREKKLATMLYKLSKKLGIKAICTQDTHYARKEDWEAQDVLLAIQTLDSIQNPNRKITFNSQDFYLKPYEQMVDRYKKAPELLTNTVEIANKIETGLIKASEDLLPNFELPEGFENEEAYLKELVTNGMKQKGLINKKEYRERVRYEMSVITKCNYTKYFLILWDIINFARTEGIRVGIGRGSAVSSLCLYVLGITKLDPVKYGLIFERFLNPDRISPPDVDIDFDYDRRPEVYNYIINKYGTDYCSQIGTYNKLMARQAIRSTVKALDLGNDYKIMADKKAKNPNAKVEVTKHSLDIADRIAKLVPFKPGAKIQDAMKNVADLREAMHKYPKLMACVLKIEGTLKSAGVHPAGILVCKDPVIEHVPLRASKGVTCSQFDGPEVEYLGLLKFDLLALKTLTVVDKTVQMIKMRHKKDIDVDELEPNDPKVFKILNGEDPKKDTRGIFQFEAQGISRLLAAIHVDRFEDMIVANALYRPGPLGAGVHDMYCNYKHGRREIEYLHPKMGEALKDTYGIMVFQENIMKVAQVLAGFTGAQADTLRKAMGKKIPELLAEQKELFIDGCKKNDISKAVAEKIFEQIDYFSGYGFNKSHSAAYAFLAYQTAWLKQYYPIEFMCNLLSSEIGDEDKSRMYLDQADRMGIICMPEDINKSGLRYKIQVGQHANGETLQVLRKPLTGLKGVGSKAVNNIVENQPFTDLEDFLARIDSRLVNSAVFKTLVNSGCMKEAFDLPPEYLLSKYDEVKKKIDKDKKAKAKQKKKMKEYGGGSLFDTEPQF
jgi:DNA polymerase-3 subunit alpha